MNVNQLMVMKVVDRQEGEHRPPRAQRDRDVAPEAAIGEDRKQEDDGPEDSMGEDLGGRHVAEQLVIGGNQAPGKCRQARAVEEAIAGFARVGRG